MLARAYSVGHIPCWVGWVSGPSESIGSNRQERSSSWVCLYTNPAAQCLRQPVGAGALGLACSSFEAIAKRCRRGCCGRSGGGLATTHRGRRRVQRSRVTRARRVESGRWVYDRKMARGERLTGQRTHWQWSRAESGRARSGRVEPSLDRVSEGALE